MFTPACARSRRTAHRIRAARRVVAFTLCAVLSIVGRAAAHPAGWASVNRYLGIECERGGVLRVSYLLDFAELPSYAEFERLDADHDGTVTPGEQRAYLDERIAPLIEVWTVKVNGTRATLRVTGSNLELREGERGLSTMRIAVEVAAERTPPLDPQVAEIHVDVSDPNFSDRSGWREIAGNDSAAAVLRAGNRERTSEALAYASGTSAGPPRIDHAELTFRLASPNGATMPVRADTTPASSSDPVPGAGRESLKGAEANDNLVLGPVEPNGRNARLVVDERVARVARAMKRSSTSGSFAVLAVALAALLGTVHALSPGHGKALAAAHLVGGRARWSDALVFGCTVSAAHTAIVFAIGVLAVAIERAMGSERLLRGLECASAISVLGLGLVQLSRHWREVARTGFHHSHAPLRANGDVGARSIVALGASVGLTPCPAALALLLAAIALHRYALGLTVVLAFSLGVATTLTAVGALVLLARRVLEPISHAAPVLRWLPVLSSACVVAIGILLCASTWS